MDKIKDALAKVAPTVRKAVVAFLVPVVLIYAHSHGLDVDNQVVETLVGAVVTALIVYLVPNAKPELDEEGK
jgi:hypothetical protein